MDSLLHFDGLNERLNYTDPNNNNDENYSASANSAITLKDKYSLRPRSLRRVTEHLHPDEETTNSSDRRGSHRQNSKSHKQKQKPAPLSKYRRKTANARERNRMREINQAFETLRQVIPHMQAAPQQAVPASNEKLTKITTLRLAMKYIASLSAALNGPSSEAASIETLSDYSDLECLLLESDGESLPLSDHSSLPDFPEPSLSPVDFSDPSLPALLHTDFTEHSLEPGDFSEFLLT